MTEEALLEGHDSTHPPYTPLPLLSSRDLTAKTSADTVEEQAL